MPIQYSRNLQTVIQSSKTGRLVSFHNVNRVTVDVYCKGQRVRGYDKGDLTIGKMEILVRELPAVTTEIEDAKTVEMKVIEVTA